VVTPATGVLVPPGDAPSLAGALRGLASDAALCCRLGAAGPARARELCDPAQQLRRLHQLLGDEG
jgi:hypothetical protein